MRIFLERDLVVTGVGVGPVGISNRVSEGRLAIRVSFKKKKIPCAVPAVEKD